MRKRTSRNDGTIDRAGVSFARKIAALLSAILWAGGFFLAFVIAPKSPCIWLPDTLLLLGFAPLLIVWRPAWPWFVFGFCNILIGFVLEVLRFLPDAGLPGLMPPIRRHLIEYHAPLVWMFAGALSIVYGFLRIVKGLFVLLSGRKRSQ